MGALVSVWVSKVIAVPRTLPDKSSVMEKKKFGVLLCKNSFPAFHDGQKDKLFGIAFALV